MALSDNLGFVQMFHEFLSLILNCKVRMLTVYQDNTLVISLVTTGGGIMQTKHMHTRMHLGLEAVMEKCFTIEYVHTSQMFADGLTKQISIHFADER